VSCSDIFEGEFGLEINSFFLIKNMSQKIFKTQRPGKKDHFSKILNAKFGTDLINFLD